MIINIRGSSGSGKSTLTARLSDALWQRADKVSHIHIEKHKKLPAVEYIIQDKSYVLLKETFKTPKEAVDFIFEQPHDVKIIEGYTLSLNKKQSQRFPKDRTSIVWLATTADDCIRSIASRRRSVGIIEPVKPAKVRADHAKIVRMLTELEREGYTVYRENRDTALPRLLYLLGFPLP